MCVCVCVCVCVCHPITSCAGGDRRLQSESIPAGPGDNDRGLLDPLTIGEWRDTYSASVARAGISSRQETGRVDETHFFLVSTTLPRQTSSLLRHLELHSIRLVQACPDSIPHSRGRIIWNSVCGRRRHEYVQETRSS